MAQRPHSEAFKRIGIGDRFGVLDDKLLHRSLRLREGIPVHKPAWTAGTLAATNIRRLPSCPTSTSAFSGSGAAPPSLRVSRLVGRSAGRARRPWTSRIHYKVRAFAGVPLDQLEKPTRAANADRWSGVEGSAETRHHVADAVG